MDVNEARKKLELALGESLWAQYFAFLKQWQSLKHNLTRDTFDEKVQKLFTNEEQLTCHMNFMNVILPKLDGPTVGVKVQSPKAPIISMKGAFEPVDYPEYIKSKSTDNNNPTTTFTYPRAATEFVVPYKDQLSRRMTALIRDKGLSGVDEEIGQLLTDASDVFLKTIIMAMITKAKGFKIRETKFQYGFNSAIPNPYLGSSFTDEKLGSCFEDDRQSKGLRSIERTVYEKAFAYSASKDIRRNIVLDSKLLYATLRDNPKLLGQYGMQSVQLLKLNLQIND